MTVTVDDIIPARVRQSPPKRKLQMILPEDLHGRIQNAARTRHMSMNALLTELLTKVFPAEDAGTKNTQ